MKNYFPPYALSLILCLILGSCNNGSSRLGKECKEYDAFFKNNWMRDNATSLYFLKDNPEWWYEHQYFDPACLNGRKGKEIVKLFGSPSKDFRFEDFSLLIYCFDEECLKPIVSKGKWIQFYLDSTKTVTSIITSPPMQMRPPDE